MDGTNNEEHKEQSDRLLSGNEVEMATLCSPESGDNSSSEKVSGKHQVEINLEFTFKLYKQLHI